MTHAGETAGRAVGTGLRTRKAAKGVRAADDLAVTEPSSRRGRRWPWLIAMVIAAAGTVIVLRSRKGRTNEPSLVEDTDEHMTPMPRQEQPEGQLNRHG
ncbi:MAG TPA: hypothetical protein VH352_12975 [Pseudonocardiaceae bacterium]|nr:hypothetical protein [Pseudonocardiaceae bacterium]